MVLGWNRVVSRFLYMCPTTSSAAESIYSVLTDRLAEILQSSVHFIRFGMYQ